MPLVVPQLKTITLGGAVTGLGIESTSFRNGLPHESVLEFDVITGAGEVVTAGPAGEHADLFRGFPNSYGTLGYATRLRIELEPVRPYVALRHVRFGDLDELAADRRSDLWTGPGTANRWTSSTASCSPPAESYLSLGSWADVVPAVSDYTGQADLLPLAPGPRAETR